MIETLTIKQIRKYKRYGKEFIESLAGIYIHEKRSLSIIMYCRTPTVIEFRTKLRFNQQDLITTKEQSVLTKIMKVFASKEILLQHSVLSYRIDLHFPKHRLAIKVDEKGQKDRNKCKEVEREKTIKEHLHCKSIRIHLDEKDFDMYVETGKIYNHINRSSKRLSIDKISKRLSEL